MVIKRGNNVRHQEPPKMSDCLLYLARYLLTRALVRFLIELKILRCRQKYPLSNQPKCQWMIQRRRCGNPIKNYTNPAPVVKRSHEINRRSWQSRIAV